MNKKLSFSGKLIALANVLVAISMILAYLATGISPEKHWFLAFFGLLFPVFLLLNLLFLLFWLVKKHLMIVLSLGILLIGFGKASSYFSVNMFSKNDIEDGLRVMSFNVQNFDLYNWNHNVASRDTILSLIRIKDPDVICFQEFYSEDQGTFDNEQKLWQMGYKDQHFFKTLSLKGGKHFGLAIFSKFPLANSGSIPFDNSKNHACIYTDLVVQEDTFRVFNVHLQSIHFQQDDYAYIDQVTQSQATDVKSSRRILSKLKHGFIKRAPQAELAAAAIRACPHPAIVCCDLNDTPISYAYQQISKGLQDAFLAKGFGIGRTYAGNIQALRIDYIFFSGDFRIKGFDILKKSISDHFPVLASFELRN